MAHVTKISAGGMRGLSNHVERKTDNHKNKMIDNSKTGQNYSLDNHENPMDYYQQRLGEVRVNQRRDDIKVAASWVITQPRDITPDESRKFFEAAHNFMAKRYGENNVVWSRVHMDETTPHLHFCFMPITPDKKHEGQEKLCAKDVLNRKELLKFHGDISAEMSRIFGREIGIETGQTEKNMPLEKLKVKTALEATAESINKKIAEGTVKLQKIEQEGTDKIAEWNARLKPTLDGMKLAEELYDKTKQTLFAGLTKKFTIDVDLLNRTIEYLRNSGAKDEVIAEQRKEIAGSEAKKDAEIAGIKAERDKANVQWGLWEKSSKTAATERDQAKAERDAAKAEQQKDRALLDVIREKAPQILEKAAEVVKERERSQARGRGMSR